MNIGPSHLARAESLGLHPSQPCLAEETAAAFVERRLASAEHRLVEEHIDQCAPCRQLISVLLQFEQVGSASSPSLPGEPAAGACESAPILPRGAALGRYVVLKCIGSGGMGVVYAAYDPELDRAIALKLLHGTGDTAQGAGRTRLLREAQAMARVAHPNVIGVHDVGTVGAQVFVAMELVDGVTLTEWLRASSRSLPQILGAFVAAGRGLTAAHAAGLVHRDFKPDNVLVSEDGRVRVTDFGLAQGPRSNAPGMEGPPLVPSESSAEVSRTKPGAVMGTPAFMSPEQQLGNDVDSRTDQFSFCVALYHAIYQEFPFAGATQNERFVEIIAGRVRPSKTGLRVPRELRRVLLRGLCAQPDQRYGSMDALLAELAIAPRRARLKWALAAATLGAACLAVFGSQRSRDAGLDRCDEGQRRVSLVWGKDRKERTRRAFLASAAPFAHDAWGGVEQTIDEYARGWGTMERDVCEARRARRERPEPSLALRSICLDRLLDETRALANVLENADAVVVENAAAAAHALTPLATCVSVDAVTRQVPPPEASNRARVEELRSKLDEIKAHLDAGKYVRGLELARSAAVMARAIGYRPALAEVLYLEGALHDQLADEQLAEQSLYEAAWTAEAGRDDRVAAQALTMLVWVVGYRQARYEVGHAFARTAGAAVARNGSDPVVEGGLENNLGSLAWAEGKYGDALLHYERAAALWQKAFGLEHPFVANALNNAGLVLWNQGRYAEAAAKIEVALRIRQTVLGAEHPSVASSFTNVGLILYSRARYSDSAAYYEKALAIEQKALGANHLAVADVLNNLGLARHGEGRDEEASRLLKEGLRIRQEHRSAEHPDIANSLLNLGIVHHALGQDREAMRELEAARGLQLNALGPDHPDFAETLAQISRVLLAGGNHADAVAQATRSVTIAEKALRPGHPLLVLALTQLAEALLSAGAPARAMALLDRARSSWSADDGDALDEAQMAFALARAVWQSGGERGRAVDLAARARELYAREGRRGGAGLRQATAWLSEHGRGPITGHSLPRDGQSAK